MVADEVAVLCRCIAALLHCRYEESTTTEAGGGGLMAKFLAARSKVEARPGQGSKKPARIMRTLDPLAATSVECDGRPAPPHSRG